nr:NADH-quinone oxidoreductase subunit N [Anaerolineae bacterium]
MFTESIPFLQVVVPILPEIGLLILLLTVLLVDLFTRLVRKRTLGVVTGVGMIVIMLANLFVGFSLVNDASYAGTALGGMIRYDMLALMFRTMVLIAGALTAFISIDTPVVGKQGEYFGILTVATMGLSLMSAAADLMMVFLAVETASISLYILAGFLRDSKLSTEAGLKYYLFGAATAGLFLYGLSLLFGFTGETNIYNLAAPLGEMFAGDDTGAFAVAVALLLLLVGFGFKVAAVPFHFWTPDVYQGAPTSTTAFISTASKAASFALLVRVFDAVWPVEVAVYWTGLLAAMAVITMTLGNLLAIVQKNIKRMLAYSSIAQAGYTLIGVVALTETDLGTAAVAFYMFMYVLTNIAAFTVISVISNTTGTDEIADFAGLSRRSFPLTLAMILALLSLSGVPPLAGFFGKFFLFAAAVDAGYTWLAIIGVLNAIVALYYYLTVVKVMFVDPNEDTRPLVITPAFAAVLWISGVGILLMGVIAAPWWNWALNAAQSITAMAP